MSNSGRKINYSIRPAKNIERKMMRDLFLRLSSFGRLEDYRYVGFGSKYFVDFVIFHKYLNISNMISIEADVNNRARYEFNKPYSSINMKWGRSTEVLPEIAVKSERTIYWLDYDGQFQKYMLDDIAIVSESINSGSILSLSFNCEALEIPDLDEEEDYLRGLLTEMVGKDFVPTPLETRGWRSSKRIAKFIRECVGKKIDAILKDRNIGIEDFNGKIQFSQKLFFTYSDGAAMATLAFVFFSESDRSKVDSCRFSDLYYCRENEEPFEITTPNLTIKEIRHLMEIRPDVSKINEKIFAEKDVHALWKNYRYFPGFSEIESF